MSKISVSNIRKKSPCYDPTEIKGVTDETSMTLLKWMDVKGYKHGDMDKVWLFSKFADELDCRTFAIWCARRCKTDVPEIKAYIDSIEGYYLLKTHIKEQMSAAGNAADSAVYGASYKAADWAAYCTADCASYKAVYRATYCAAYSAAYWAADCAADCAAEVKAQVEKIKRLLKQGGGR